MKKSEVYTMAMVAVLDCERFTVIEKLEILEPLMDQRKSERWCEEKEAEKNADLP